jgi:hypothetical protein
MNKLAKQLEGLEGYTEIEIRGYKSTSGDVTDVTLDVATTYGQAKDMDHELLKDYKDIDEVKELREASEGHKGTYDDLWVKAYDALSKSLLPKTTPMGVSAKVVVPPKPVCKGIVFDEVKEKCYIKGFIKDRTVISTDDTKVGKVSKKQVLTLFKEHMRNKFITTQFMTYAPESGSVSIEGKTLIIDCNEN